MSQKFRVKQIRIKSELANRSGIVTENMTSATPDHEVGTSFKNVQVNENGEFVVGPVGSGSGTQYTNSATAPVSPNIGDYREDNAGVIRVRDGTGWKELEDPSRYVDYTQQTTAPIDPNIGDYWEDDNGVVYLWNGASWSLIENPNSGGLQTSGIKAGTGRSIPVPSALLARRTGPVGSNTDYIHLGQDGRSTADNQRRVSSHECEVNITGQYNIRLIGNKSGNTSNNPQYAVINTVTKTILWQGTQAISNGAFNIVVGPISLTAGQKIAVAGLNYSYPNSMFFTFTDVELLFDLVLDPLPYRSDYDEIGFGSGFSYNMNTTQPYNVNLSGTSGQTSWASGSVITVATAGNYRFFVRDIRLDKVYSNPVDNASFYILKKNGVAFAQGNLTSVGSTHVFYQDVLGTVALAAGDQVQMQFNNNANYTINCYVYGSIGLTLL